MKFDAQYSYMKSGESCIDVTFFDVQTSLVSKACEMNKYMRKPESAEVKETQLDKCVESDLEKRFKK